MAAVADGHQEFASSREESHPTWRLRRNDRKRGSLIFDSVAVSPGYQVMVPGFKTPIGLGVQRQHGVMPYQNLQTIVGYRKTDHCWMLTYHFASSLDCVAHRSSFVSMKATARHDPRENEWVMVPFIGSHITIFLAPQEARWRSS
jgi:hypothetical protein